MTFEHDLKAGASGDGESEPNGEQSPLSQLKQKPIILAAIAIGVVALVGVFLYARKHAGRALLYGAGERRS